MKIIPRRPLGHLHGRKRRPRASRLSGPAPKCVINGAAPSMDTLFMSIAICIPRIIGSGTAQKLCIVSVTGTRNSTNSHAPNLAL